MSGISDRIFRPFARIVGDLMRFELSEDARPAAPRRFRVAASSPHGLPRTQPIGRQANSAIGPNH